MGRFTTLTQDDSPLAKPKVAVESSALWVWRHPVRWWEAPVFLDMNKSLMDKASRMNEVVEVLPSSGVA